MGNILCCSNSAALNQSGSVATLPNTQISRRMQLSTNKRKKKFKGNNELGVNQQMNSEAGSFVHHTTEDDDECQIGDVRMTEQSS